jgi:hypothetical protein
MGSRIAQLVRAVGRPTSLWVLLSDRAKEVSQDLLRLFSGRFAEFKMKSTRVDWLLKCWHIESRICVGESDKSDGNTLPMLSRNSSVVVTLNHLTAGFECVLVAGADYDQCGYCHYPLVVAARRIERNGSAKPMLGFDTISRSMAESVTVPVRPKPTTKMRFRSIFSCATNQFNAR